MPSDEQKREARELAKACISAIARVDGWTEPSRSAIADLLLPLIEQRDEAVRNLDHTLGHSDCYCDECRALARRFYTPDINKSGGSSKPRCRDALATATKLLGECRHHVNRQVQHMVNAGNRAEDTHAHEVLARLDAFLSSHKESNDA